MANYEATKYNFSGSDLTGIEGIPTATIVPWSSSSVPTGFLECDGSAVSRTTYSALFGVVSTTYGAGDGSSTFNVPNLSDKIAMGKSGTKALASTGGANTVTSTGNVGGSTANASITTGQLAAHTHGCAVRGPQASSGPGKTEAINGSTSSTGSDEGHSHNMSANFSGDATSVLQPYLTLIYVIKT